MTEQQEVLAMLESDANKTWLTKRRRAAALIREQASVIDELHAALDAKDAETQRLRNALNIAREGYDREAATGQPVRPQWRERAVALIDAALAAYVGAKLETTAAPK